MQKAKLISISRLFLSMVTAVGVAGLISCAKHQDTNTKDTLRVDIGNEVSTVDPAKTEVAPDFRVVNDLFAGLIDWDQKNQPIPGLSSSWEISPDGKIYTFHLRHGLKFSDGSPIYAHDFIYSWERLLDPKTAASYGFLLNGVVNANAIMNGTKTPTSLGVSALDNYTFVVNLEHPMNEFLSYLTAPALDVVPEKTIVAFGDSWTEPKNIVTSGAYVLKDHVMNGYLLATKNPNFYAANQVAIKNIKYVPITDTNVALDTYRAGDLDTTWQNIPVDKFTDIKNEFPDELHVITWEKTVFYNFNMNLPKYANNLKLRQALTMAIDRNALSKHVLSSGEKPLYSIVTPSIEHGKYNNKYSWADMDNETRIKMARQLYKEAGYSLSQPLVVNLKYKNNDLDKKTALAIASMWQSTLGVNVKLENLEYKSLLQSLHRGDFDIAEGNWGADYDSVTTYTSLYRCKNGNNHSFYCNSKYDAILDKAAVTRDKTAQTALYNAAITIANNDYATLQLYEPTHQRLVKPRVKGYEIDENYLDNLQSKWFSLSK